jgi:hypothetical protein
MSFTAVYTPLYPVATDTTQMQWSRNAYGAGVRITDPDGLDEHVPDWDTTMDTREVVDRDEYPGSEWTYLLGFTTWGDDEDDGADYHNIERLGFYYNREEAAEFWAGVSEYTEAFQFYTSPFEWGWPHALDLVKSENPVAMLVQCDDGEVSMWEFAVEGIEETEVEL